MIFYFSGSGNTLWLAQQLAEISREKCVSIAEAVREARYNYVLNDSERVGFVFPVYGWSMPTIVRNFIDSLELENNRENYIYFAATYGDDMGTTEAEVRKLLSQKGWTLGSAFSVRMPNTYVCLPGFDVDNDQLRDWKLLHAPKAVEEMGRMILERRCGKSMTFPGKWPWLKTHILGGFFRRYLMSSKKFWVNDACVGCEKCTKVCALHNITMNQGKPSWGDNCAMCLACYHHCPQHAVQYGKATLGKGQYYYRFPVSPKESALEK